MDGRESRSSSRADLSRRRLVDALIVEMRERPYAQINATDIATRAGLSRRTYHRVASGKDDLISFRCVELVDEYVGRLPGVDLADTRQIAVTFFEFWSDHVDFLLALSAAGMKGVILTKLNEHIRDVAERSGTPRFADAPDLDYALAFTVGGYFNVLFEWLRRGARESPAQMADALAEFTAG